VIEQYLPEETGHQKTIFQAMNYSVRAGGKRLRPMLMEETYRLFGGQGQEIEPFMAAIEMIHTSSLIHDDLPCMDNDQLRRGMPTVWVKYGYDMAVLAGDALLIYAVETGIKACAMTKDGNKVAQAVGILAKKTGIYGMIGGQVVDVQLTNQPIPREKLDFIYRLKTGALLEAAMMIGALLGGASEIELGQVERMASLIGIAFQIQDDILDVTATTEQLGKPAGSDEKNQKTTYVTLEGIEKAKEDVARISAEAIEILHSLPGENLFLEELIRILITREK
jgi:geranylgeranyl diphosphate synthase type II